MQKLIPACLLVSLIAAPATAEVKTKKIQYTHGGTQLEGYLAWDDSTQEKRPGVLLVHEWWGLNEYARDRAEQLAELGYVSFALDMFGQGKVTRHPAEAREWATQIRSNQEQWLARAGAGLQVLREQPQVDQSRVAAIGYCFGGSTALLLGLTGAELKGVVSFHGALPSVEAEQAAKSKARLLVLHGAADNFIPLESIQNFQDTMNEAGVDWTMISYGGAKHSFTNPKADEYGVAGIEYQERADRRSWRHMQQFFDEIFAK